MKKIYLDNAASTPVDKRVLKEMIPYFSERYGNASSLHSFGRQAHEAKENSRTLIAKKLGTSSDEIYFTSSATESNNTVLKGIANANKNKGKHIITTKIEHPCILKTAQYLSNNGFTASYLPVDKHGLVDPDDLKKALKTHKDTILVSIMYANNEIGTIEPIKELASITKQYSNAYFHTDATQAFGKTPIDLENIDMLSTSAHKLYGPKGVGMLYIKRGTKIQPLLHGGGQEKGLRGSTENVPGIVGFAKAIELAFDEMNKEMKRETKLRNKLIKEVLKITASHLNGHATKRLPNNANFYFDFVEGESLVLLLDQKGIAASTGSACSSTKLEASHVLTAIGLRPEQAHGSLRLTLGRFTTQQDIDYVLKVLPELIEKLRKISNIGK